MKQLLTIGCAAVLVGLAFSGTADAWINNRFSVGLNWSRQSGNNNLFWGAWRNGQIPGGGHDGFGYGYGPPPGGPAGPVGPDGFPWFGNNNQAPSNMPQATAYAPAQGTPYAGSYDNGSNFYQASYQAAAYQPYSYASYAPSYYGSYYNYNVNTYTPNYTDPYAWYYQR